MSCYKTYTSVKKALLVKVWFDMNVILLFQRYLVINKQSILVTRSRYIEYNARMIFPPKEVQLQELFCNEPFKAY